MNLPSNGIPVRSVDSLLDDAVARFGTSAAMDFLGRGWTYAELGDLVARAAFGFRQLGVRDGVRVGLCLPNSPYFVISYYAILKAGGIVVNFNPLYVEREMAHQVEDSGTSILVTLDQQQLYPKVAGLLEKTCLRQVVVCAMADILPALQDRPSDCVEIPDAPGITPFRTLISFGGQLVSENTDPKSTVAVLQYTGGTTGVPKGAVLTHANLTVNVAQIRHWVSGARPGEERLLCALPLFHVFAMTVAMNLGISLGAELILLPRFDLEQVFETISRKKPTFFPGVPTMYTAINNAAKSMNSDLTSIRWCISGGAPLPLKVREEFEHLTGCRLVEGYGLSEASPVVSIIPLNGVTKDGSIGLPVLGTVVEIHSAADPSKILDVSQAGELWVRGPQVMTGYWQRDEETSAVLTTDGALRTGDVGYRDEDGYIFLVDRVKDLIICSGYNVYPRVIEEALYRHPAVAETIVIGIADAYRGQSPKAFVRLRDGVSATRQELMTFLTDHLSPIEMPKVIEFRNSLPKTAVGKLSKKELLAEEQPPSAPPRLAG